MPELLPSPLLATSAERLADHAQTSSLAATATVDMEDLRCPICFALMLAPRVLPGCGGQRSHSFCAPCITFWLQHQKDTGLAVDVCSCQTLALCPSAVEQTTHLG